MTAHVEQCLLFKNELRVSVVPSSPKFLVLTGVIDDVSTVTTVAKWFHHSLTKESY